MRPLAVLPLLLAALPLASCDWGAPAARLEGSWVGVVAYEGADTQFETRYAVTRLDTVYVGFDEDASGESLMFTRSRVRVIETRPDLPGGQEVRDSAFERVYTNTWSSTHAGLRMEADYFAGGSARFTLRGDELTGEVRVATIVGPAAIESEPVTMTFRRRVLS